MFFIVNAFIFCCISFCGAEGAGLEEDVNAASLKNAQRVAVEQFTRTSGLQHTKRIEEVRQNVSLLDVHDFSSLGVFCIERLGLHEKFSALGPAKKAAFDVEIEKMKSDGRSFSLSQATIAQITFAIEQGEVLDALCYFAETVLPAAEKVEWGSKIHKQRIAKRVIDMTKPRKEQIKRVTKDLLKKRAEVMSQFDCIFGICLEDGNVAIDRMSPISKKYFGVRHLLDEVGSSGFSLGVDNGDIAVIKTPVTHLKNVYMLADAVLQGAETLTFFMPEDSPEKTTLSDVVFRACNSFSWCLQGPKVEKNEKSELTLIGFRESVRVAGVEAAQSFFEVKLGLGLLLSSISGTFSYPRIVHVSGGMRPAFMCL